MNYVAQCRQVRISKAFGFNFFNSFNLFNSLKKPLHLPLPSCSFTPLFPCFSKQGFFALQTRLLYNANKPCFDCKEALFANAGYCVPKCAKNCMEVKKRARFLQVRPIFRTFVKLETNAPTPRCAESMPQRAFMHEKTKSL